LALISSTVIVPFFLLVTPNFLDSLDVHAIGLLDVLPHDAVAESVILLHSEDCRISQGDGFVQQCHTSLDDEHGGKDDSEYHGKDESVNVAHNIAI
jgi:hypothetical protein